MQFSKLVKIRAAEDGIESFTDGSKLMAGLNKVINCFFAWFVDSVVLIDKLR